MNRSIKLSGIFENAAFNPEICTKGIKLTDADIIFCNFFPYLTHETSFYTECKLYIDSMITPKMVGDCLVTISFSATKNPGVKENILAHLTESYEKRIGNI